MRKLNVSHRGEAVLKTTFNNNNVSGFYTVLEFRTEVEEGKKIKPKINRLLLNKLRYLKSIFSTTHLINSSG